MQSSPITAVSDEAAKEVQGSTIIVKPWGDERRGERFSQFLIQFCGHIYLIYLFAWNEQDNLITAQKRIIANLVYRIKEADREKK